jgi:hypothetical protein
LETNGKVVERHGSIGMSKRMKCQCSSMELNGLIQVRLSTTLFKSAFEAIDKVVES